MNNNRHTVIIAEAGVNHNGSLEMAKKMVDAAADAGVDYVKFQTFCSELLVTASAAQADYQRREAQSEDSSQLAMLRKLELSHADHLALMDYCKQKGVKFLSTAFDLPSIDFLDGLGVDFWKVPSGEITNLPYLRKIAATRRPIVMSTGMSDLDTVKESLDFLLGEGADRKDITLLHCNTEYPTPFADVNLNAMITLRDELCVATGYSDHTLGIEVPVAAVALGAQVIEKHFTLDRNLPGPDHKASLLPDELKAMVSAIRNIEKALGTGLKRVTDSEAKNIVAARKSIVAAVAIKAGEVFTEENLTVKRPGNGLSPMKWYDVVGRQASRDYQPDEPIEI
ncbi:MAG: N-acetylneuraminate synthase [Muribaculaceae bacterium]|nr:N-acetylneuraminate synthase [Muribaculaceae bacterium]